MPSFSGDILILNKMSVSWSTCSEIPDLIRYLTKILLEPFAWTDLTLSLSSTLVHPGWINRMQLLYNYYINLVLIVHWFDFQTTSSKALTSRCRLRESMFLMYVWYMYLRCCDFPFWSLMGCLHLLVSRHLFILFIFISMYRFRNPVHLSFPVG